MAVILLTRLWKAFCRIKLFFTSDPILVNVFPNVQFIVSIVGPINGFYASVNYVNIGSDNGLSPEGRQAII